MKSKIILTTLLSIIYLSCASDDSERNELCYMYFVYVVDDENNCNCDSVLCSNLVFISEKEYNRLLIIKENLNGICPLIDVMENVSGNIFNGYLATIGKDSCIDYSF